MPLTNMPIKHYPQIAYHRPNCANPYWAFKYGNKLLNWQYLTACRKLCGETNNIIEERLFVSVKILWHITTKSRPLHCVWKLVSLYIGWPSRKTCRLQHYLYLLACSEAHDVSVLEISEGELENYTIHRLLKMRIQSDEDKCSIEPEHFRIVRQDIISSIRLRVTFAPELNFYGFRKFTHEKIPLVTLRINKRT